MNCCKHFVEKHFQEGSTICVFGEETQLIGIVKSGEAKLVKLHKDGRELLLEFYEKNSIFGEAFTIQGDNVEALQVVCTRAAVIQFIPYKILLNRCETPCTNHGSVVDFILYQLSRKAALLNERVQILAQPTIREKLNCYFRTREARGNKKTFEIPFSYTELSQYLSADRSAVMRELKHMEEEGEIRRIKRKIVLLSQE